MAAVYLGKVVIPAEEMENYFSALGDRETEFKPLEQQLQQLREEFEEDLTEAFSRRTANKHSVTILHFIDFLQWHTDVTSIQEITRGMANSYFRKWYVSKIGDLTESELKTGIKKFFKFLAEKKGIVNEEVLKSFKR